MSTATDRRPYAKVTPYTWMNGDQPTAGIVFKHGAKPFLHVTPAEGRALADKLHDLADKIEAEPMRMPKATSAATSAPEQPKAPREPQPCYVSRSDTVTAADGSAEAPLPTTAAE